MFYTIKLHNIIKSVNWNEIYVLCNLDSATNKFINILNTSVQHSTIFLKIKNKIRKRSKWITQSLIKAINIKNNLYKTFKHNPKNEEIKDRYFELKKKVEKLIKKTKIDYYKDQIKNKKNDSTQMWKTINEVLTIPEPTKVVSVKNENNEIITSMQQISESFNKYFVNVSKSLANKIKCNKDYKPPRYINAHSIFFSPTNNQEVIRIISDLKNKKAPGDDGLKAETLKLISEYIASPLTYIINKMFQLGKFPTALKLSIVTPIFKNGDKSEMGNYRPVSLISNIAKIVEKIIKIRLTNFLEKQHIIKLAIWLQTKNVNPGCN